MKSKGFTLIEVISVLVILSFIILIAVPSVSKVIKKSKERAYNTQISEIISATKSWILLNGSNAPTDEETIVPVSLLQLKLANLLPYDFENPKTSSPFPDDMMVNISKRGRNLIYNVVENSGSSNEILNPNAPRIILNGGISQVIEINGNYSELGAVAKDIDDNIINVTKTISNGNNTVNAIDTSHAGEYTITYSANKNGLTSTIKRLVSVKDTTPPIIIILGYTNDQYISQEATASFTLPDASVIDNSGELIEPTVYGNFSSTILGNKKVTYEAIDSSGNKGNFILNFNIIDTILPSVSISNETNSTTGRKTITVNASDNGSGLSEYPYSFDNGVTWQKENTYVFEGTYNSTIIVRDKAKNENKTVYTVN